MTKMFQKTHGIISGQKPTNNVYILDERTTYLFYRYLKRRNIRKLGKTGRRINKVISRRDLFFKY